MKLGFTEYAVLATAGLVLYTGYKAKRLAGNALDAVGEGLDQAQQSTTDGLAEISGLADYERALMAAKTPEEVQALREAWENRPWYKRIL